MRQRDSKRLHVVVALVVVFALVISVLEHGKCFAQSAGSGKSQKVGSDNSLTEAEYIQRGFPSPDKEWNTSDLATAVKILEEMSGKGDYSFPRYKSKKSGKLFTKLSSSSFPKRDRADKSTLKEYVKRCADDLSSVQKIYTVYSKAFQKGSKFSSEVIELLVSLGRGMILTDEYADKFYSSVKEQTEEQAKIRNRCSKEAKKFLGKFASSSIVILSARNSFSKDDSFKLLGFMKEGFPSIVEKVRLNHKLNIYNALDELQKSELMNDLQPEMNELCLEIKASVKPLVFARYDELGFPSLEKEWSEDDYTKSAEILKSILEKESYLLPRYKNGLSGKLFAKLSSTSILKKYNDESNSLDKRFNNSVKQHKAVTDMFIVYSNAIAKRINVLGEFVELYRAMLKTTVTLNETSKKVLALSKSDPDYNEALSSYDSMRKGIGLVMCEALALLTNPDSLSEDERKRFFSTIQSTYPRLVESIPAEKQTELLGLFDKLEKGDTLGTLRPELSQLHKQVKGLLK